MNSKNPYWLNIFLYIIFIIKLSYLYILFRLRISKKDKKNDKIEFFENLKEIFHTIFFILMSILMIILFEPFYNRKKIIQITGHTKLFLFIFAILILIGIDYQELIEEINYLILTF